MEKNYKETKQKYNSDKTFIQISKKLHIKLKEYYAHQYGKDYAKGQTFKKWKPHYLEMQKKKIKLINAGKCRHETLINGSICEDCGLDLLENGIN